MIYVVLMGTSSMIGTHNFWDDPTYFQKNFTKVFKRLYNVGLPWWLIGKEFGSQMQETHVRSLVREDLTCRGATKPACHSYWTGALEPRSHNCWALQQLGLLQQLLQQSSCNNALQLLKPLLPNQRSHRNEKLEHRMRDRPHPPQLHTATKTRCNPEQCFNKRTRKK